jgi:hypothetical protein
MRKIGKGKDPKLNNLILGFAEQIAWIGILWAVLYAKPQATASILSGLGMTLPYFPFATSIFIIVFLVGFYINLILPLKQNVRGTIRKGRRR